MARRFFLGWREGWMGWGGVGYVDTHLLDVSFDD